MKTLLLFGALVISAQDLAAQQFDAQIANDLAQKAFDAHRPDSAYYYAQKALLLAKEGANKNQQHKAAIHIGTYYEIQGNYGKALDQFMDALKLADDEKELLISYDKIGIIYGMANEFGQSIENLNLALKHAHFPEDKIMVFNDLGKVYAKQDKFARSREYFLQALDIAETQGNTRRKIDAYAYLGQLASREKNYPEAINYYHKVISINNLLGNTEMKPYNLMILGKQYHALQKFDSAKLYYDLAIKHTRMVNKPIVEAYVLINLAETHMAQSTFDSALYCISRTDSLAKVWKIAGQEKEVFRIKASIYDKMGNRDKSEFYKTKLKNLEDSIKRSIDEAKVREAEQKFVEKTVENGNNNYKSLSIVIVLVVASLLTFVFIRRNVHHDEAPSKTERVFSTEQQATTTNPSQEIHAEFINLISQNGEKPMRLDKIIYIEKEGKLCETCTEEGMFKLRKTLAELESELPTKKFFRINRSTIIQLDKMLNYSFWEHDKYIVRMKEGEKREFVMSRDRLKYLQQALGIPS